MGLIRLKEVAAGAGVSISTAAAALRDEPSVRASTKTLVQSVACRLGYQRNSAAAILSSHEHRHRQKSAFIAWLTAFPGAITGDAKYPWRNWLDIARQTATEMGLCFEHQNIPDLRQAERCVRALYTRGCDGIVWGRHAIEENPIIRWESFSVISTEPENLERGFDIVRSNQFRSLYALLERIKSMGYRRIGVCLREHLPVHPDDRARLGAALAFQEVECRTRDRVAVLRLRYRFKDASDLLFEWLKKQRPEVVVGFNREEARMLGAKGIRIPGDVAFAAMHVDRIEQGKIAGNQFNVELIGSEAIKVLMEKMRHGIRGLSRQPHESVVVPSFLNGDSCPPVG